MKNEEENIYKSDHDKHIKYLEDLKRSTLEFYETYGDHKEYFLNASKNLDSFNDDVSRRMAYTIGIIFKNTNLEKIDDAIICEKIEKLDEEYGPISDTISKEKIKYLLNYNKTNKNALITNFIFKITKSEKFKNDLYSNIASRKSIYRRKEILEYGYKAHVNRNYIYSIPLFFMQIEGMIQDYLLLKELIFIKKSELNGKKVNEVYFENEKGEEKKLSGLYKKSELFKKVIGNSKNSNVIMVNFKMILKILDSLYIERNYIFHGDKIKYYNCKLSNELLLYLQKIILLFPNKINNNSNEINNLKTTLNP